MSDSENKKHFESSVSPSLQVPLGSQGESFDLKPLWDDLKKSIERYCEKKTTDITWARCWPKFVVTQTNFRWSRPDLGNEEDPGFENIIRAYEDCA